MFDTLKTKLSELLQTSLSLLKIEKTKNLLKNNKSLNTYLKYHHYKKVHYILVEKKNITISKAH